MMILSHFLVVASATLVSARLPSLLKARAYTGGATCAPTFQWTDNSKNVSPCQLASEVYGACAGPSWNIPTLQPGNHYNTPAGDYVNECSCSWAAYNLISACTICQGQEQSVQTWPFYLTNCTGHTSNEYFPPDLALPDDTAIPYYAATNPTEWPDQRFNLEKAREIHDGGHADLVQSQSKKSSSSAGPIAGGVVGGLVVILLAGGLAFYLYRKKQRGIQQGTVMTHIIDDGPGHARTVSDLSSKSNGIGYGYRQMERSFATSPSSQVPLSPTSGTMHTHTSSVNSLSYFGSVNHSIAPYAVPSSPPPVARTTSPLSPSPPPVSNAGIMNRENIIVPFTLPPSENQSRQGSNANLVDRKRADGAIVPIYDSPNSLPSHVAQSTSQIGGDTSARARILPPAYSAVDEASIAPSRARPAHTKKGSGDTTYTIDSTTSGGVVSTVQHHHTSGGSVSGIDDVITQMGLTQATESVSGSGGTLMTGQSQQFGRNQPFRPVLGNPDP